MSILCSISAIKELPRTRKNNKYDSKLTFYSQSRYTGGVSVWFFKPFLMYPLSLQELAINWK